MDKQENDMNCDSEDDIELIDSEESDSEESEGIHCPLCFFPNNEYNDFCICCNYDLNNISSE